MGLVNFILALNASQTSAEEPEVIDPPVITNTFKSISNKYVDITFDQGVYATNPLLSASSFGAVVTTANLSIIDFVPGGVTNIDIAAVKMNNHYTSAGASDLIGGEYTIRVFLTLTGTPTGVESFRIRCTDIWGADGGAATLNSATLNINITPMILWDYLETSSYVTTGLGISLLEDIMEVADAGQNTDADRPQDSDGVIYFDRDNSEFFNCGDVGAVDFQKGTSFTVVIKRLNVLNSGTSGYIIANRANSPGVNGWAIQTGADGSLFFVLNDGTLQGLCDYDAFNGSGERDVLFFVNNNGTMNIYDSDGNTLGTTGNATGIGTISYTSVSLYLGRRNAVATNDLEGYWEKIAIVNSALTAPQRALYVENL